MEQFQGSDALIHEHVNVPLGEKKHGIVKLCDLGVTCKTKCPGFDVSLKIQYELFVK